MTLSFFSAILLLGTFFSLLGGVLTFWATHNLKGAAITILGVLMFVLIYVMFLLIHRSVSITFG